MLQGLRMLKFRSVLDRWQSSELSQLEAAELLGVGGRTFRRWCGRYREDGEAGLLDRRVGQEAHNRVPAEDTAWIEALYRQRFAGFTAKHFHEHLLRDPRFRWGYTWTKVFLQERGLLKLAPRRGAHRRKRPRRPPAMAYEGLDAPEVAVVAALTHIRSRGWLEQMIARATRVDPHAGPYAAQRPLVFHPDDPLFARFRRSVETEQGTVAKRVKPRAQSGLPGWLLDQLAETEREDGIVPLQSNALGLRYGLLRPGPDYVLHRPEQQAAQDEMLDPPSVLERRLRHRIGEMLAQQAVEDEGAAQVPRGDGLYHRYNAILKRCTGDKTRAQMSLSDLEAAVSWLERNRLADNAEVLQDDPRYGWTVRQRVDWTPPVGRSDGKPRRAPRTPAQPRHHRQGQNGSAG